jgi:Putative ER transporter, 6TM, N-terminal
MATETQNGHKSATKRSQIKAVLSRLTLDWDAAILALKTSLAPTVLVCLIESTTWINHFTTNSYLAPIVATCALPTLPRAKLIDYNFQLALALAVVYCYSLLAGWCGLQARRHTTSSTEELKDYNSSAEAVAAIFLIFIEWLVFTLKSAFPVWQLQCVMAGIYCVAVLPPTARAPDMATVIDITSVSIEVFLAGQAAGFVVGLFIFPQDCRTIFINDLRKSLQGLTSIMRAQMVCMNDLKANEISRSGEEGRDLSVNRLNAAVKSFIAMVAKARSGLDSAGRELAWSRLDQPALEKLGLLLVDMVVPLSGLTSAADMTQMVISGNIPRSRYKAADEVSHAPASDSAQDEEHRRQLEVSMHHRSAELCNAVIEGVDHALLRLKSEGSRPLIDHFKRRKEDVETPTSSMSAGEASFLSSYQKVLDKPCSLGLTITDHFIRAKPKDLEEMTREQYKELLRYFLILHVSASRLVIDLKMLF